MNYGSILLILTFTFSVSFTQSSQVRYTMFLDAAVCLALSLSLYNLLKKSQSNLHIYIYIYIYIYIVCKKRILFKFFQLYSRSLDSSLSNYGAEKTDGAGKQNLTTNNGVKQIEACRGVEFGGAISLNLLLAPNLLLVFHLIM